MSHIFHNFHILRAEKQFAFAFFVVLAVREQIGCHFCLSYMEIHRASVRNGNYGPN